MTNTPFYICDSVTKLLPEMRGAVVIAASHGGKYAAYLAARAGVKGVILSDAGIGKDQAGIAGLSLLDDCNIGCAAVSYLSARIGDGQDIAQRGLISTVNSTARSLGVEPGMSAAAAARLMTANQAEPIAVADLPGESHIRFTLSNARCAVALLDSASLVGVEDSGAVVITGSHGGLLGGNQASAISIPVFAAVYNDAGIGVDDAGISRLPALDLRGIAGATVAAQSACIGDARSAYEDGVLSRVNECARAYGIRSGMSVRHLVDTLCKL